MPKKQVAFDLDTKNLRKYYARRDWHKAYADIKKYMKYAGFEWKQGSVYVSEGNVSRAEIIMVLENMVNDEPWLNLCMRDCQQTNIESLSDVNFIYDKKKLLKKNNFILRLVNWLNDW